METSEHGLTDATARVRLQELMQEVLGTKPVSLMTWLIVALLAATIVPAMELHKLSWWIRGRRQS